MRALLHWRLPDPSIHSKKVFFNGKSQVAALKGFYVHLFVFVCVMLGLLGINVATKSEWWVQWPFLGWGLGILGHAIGVSMPINRVGRDWEERKIKERLAKM